MENKVKDKAGKDNLVNYKDVGLKSGIEIHQQLDTHKLFCNCPSIIVDDKEEPDLIVERSLRALAGETGVVDKAAVFEFSKEKTFVYHFYNKSCCLVELDEEPPHELNKDALMIALQFARLVNARIVDVIQVMRKTVIDGSNTSGFQRTALIATNGFITLDSGKKVGIPTICLEEDAAKIVGREGNKVVYNLSRLGIPLIEIATEPVLNTPMEVKETAEKIGLLLRSLKVKRGLGTIRQDVNVSIKDGARVEIKGAQDLRSLHKIVEFEILRQRKLIELKSELERRGIKDIEIKIGDVKDITHLFKKTRSRLLLKAMNSNERIFGFRVHKFNGLLGFELQPNKRVGTELAMHCKLFGLNGLLHSDELPNYGITKEEVDDVRKELDCKEEDAFIVITGPESIVKKAILNIIDRLKQFLTGVPEEVRKVDPDFTTSFLRPMPGSARMYPETDIPLIKPPKNIRVPKTVFERIKEYENLGLSKDLARIVALSEKREFFDYLINNYKVEPRVIAQLMFLTLKDLKRRLKLDVSKVNDRVIEEIVKALNNKIISKGAVEVVLEEFINGESISNAIEKHRLMSEEELRERIKKIIEKNKGVNNPKAMIGIVMKELRGKGDGSLIVRIVNALLNKVY